MAGYAVVLTMTHVSAQDLADYARVWYTVPVPGDRSATGQGWLTTSRLPHAGLAQLRAPVSVHQTGKGPMHRQHTLPSTAGALQDRVITTIAGPLLATRTGFDRALTGLPGLGSDAKAGASSRRGGPELRHLSAGCRMRRHCHRDALAARKETTR